MPLHSHNKKLGDTFHATEFNPSSVLNPNTLQMYALDTEQDADETRTVMCDTINIDNYIYIFQECIFFYPGS